MNFRRGLVEVFTFMILLSTTATLVAYLACSLALLVLLRRGRVRSRSAGGSLRRGRWGELLAVGDRRRGPSRES